MFKWAGCRTLIVVSSVVGSLASAVWIYKKLKNLKERGVKCKCLNHVKGKVILITGGASGIGLESATQLAKFGARLYICCRSVEAGEQVVSKLIRETGNSNVFLVHLDLTDFDTCLLGSQLQQKEELVDILIHNAGVFGANFELTKNGYDLTLQTNFLGAIAVTQSLLSLLAKSQIARIICVSSEAHKLSSVGSCKVAEYKVTPKEDDFDAKVKHYGLSKYLLRIYAFWLASKYQDLSVTSVNPGNVWTPLYRNLWTGWKDVFVRCACACFMRTPEEGCQAVLHAVNCSSLHSAGYIFDCKEIEEEKPICNQKDAEFIIAKAIHAIAQQNKNILTLI